MLKYLQRIDPSIDALNIKKEKIRTKHPVFQQFLDNHCQFGVYRFGVKKCPEALSGTYSGERFCHTIPASFHCFGVCCMTYMFRGAGKPCKMLICQPARLPAEIAQKLDFPEYPMVVGEEWAKPGTLYGTPTTEEYMPTFKPTRLRQVKGECVVGNVREEEFSIVCTNEACARRRMIYGTKAALSGVRRQLKTFVSKQTNWTCGDVLDFAEVVSKLP